ncbi:MAG: hypothetical protein QOJ99_4299, partial [Bryobacterales bacterium]|nr:hypothetical protein [Bryobacterales bacterium]
MRSLHTAWLKGEIRPTHRKPSRPTRTRRTLLDPFEEVWPAVLDRLHARPDLIVKACSGNSRLRTRVVWCQQGACVRRSELARRTSNPRNAAGFTNPLSRNCRSRGVVLPGPRNGFRGDDRDVSSSSRLIRPTSEQKCQVFGKNPHNTEGVTVAITLDLYDRESGPSKCPRRNQQWMLSAIKTESLKSGSLPQCGS